MHTLREAIETYLEARDSQRPSLIADAFGEKGKVQIHTKTDAIYFPGEILGREAIARALVTQLAERFGSLRTLCIGEPPHGNASFECGWITCMTERDVGGVLVGCGRYQWQTEPDSAALASLVVTIDTMTKLDDEDRVRGREWIHMLPHPWCAADQLRDIPDIPPIRDIVQRLAPNCPIAS